MCKFVQDKTIYWATLSYTRWWLSVDAPYLARVRAEGGKLTDEIVESFLRHYKVRRGFKPRELGLTPYLVEMANAAAKSWPEKGLLDRYRACNDLAEKWQDAKLVSREGAQQISAATKVMWLLRPDGWTLFDKFVRISMNAGSAVEFYRQLDSVGFEMCRDQMQQCIDGSPWKGMHAAKMLDYFLMRRGELHCGSDPFVWPYLDCLETEGFLAAMPAEMTCSLRSLAHELQIVSQDFAKGEALLPPRK